MHIMVKLREHEGTEEWFCDECGREVLITWTPKFIRTIVEEGDETVGHTGFKSDTRDLTH